MTWIKINDKLMYSSSPLHPNVLPRPVRLRIHLCPFVARSVWVLSRIEIKITERISTKLGLSVVLCPEETPLTFGVDPDERTNPGLFSSLSLKDPLWESWFSTLIPNSPWNCRSGRLPSQSCHQRVQNETQQINVLTNWTLTSPDGRFLPFSWISLWIMHPSQ